MNLYIAYTCSYYYSEKQSDGSIVTHRVSIDLTTGDMKDTINWMEAW